jgi:hypothetical protein
MKKMILSAFLLTAVCALTGFGQTPPKAAASPSPSSTAAPKSKVTVKTVSTAKEYEDLVKKVKGGDLNVDFALMRIAYTFTKDHSPYGGSEERSAMTTAFREKKYDETVKLADNYLKENYVDLHSHYYAALAYLELGKTKESDFHKNVLKKLLDAIWENDGLTPETALIALGISEQYFVMNIEGFERKNKTLERHNNSTFDVHHAENSKTGEKRKFFFNIDKVFGKF